MDKVKGFSKIIGICLCVCALTTETVFASTILPSNPWAAVEEKEPGAAVGVSDNIKKAVSVMNGLGFSNVSGSALNEEMSYKDFAKIINSVTGGRTQLPDSFKEKITYGDVIKILVSITGYQPVAEMRGNGLDSYISIASEKKILKGFSEPSNKNAQIGTAILLAYNAIRCDIMTEDYNGSKLQLTTNPNKNILSEYHNIYFNKGQITGDKFTQLDSMAALGDNQVSIDGVVYQKENLSSASSIELGIVGEYYYRQERGDGTLYLLHFYTDDTFSHTVSFSPREVSAYSNNCVLSIDREGKRSLEKYSISPTANVIRNNTYIGRKAHTLTLDELSFGTGSIELIDSKKSGTYDVVIIKEYENYVVNSVNASSFTIYSKYGGMPLELEDAEFTENVLRGQDNSKLTIDKIKEWNVLEVAKNDSGEITEVVLVNNIISGVVSFNSDEEIGINDETYKISKDFITSEYNASPNTEGSFVLNINDEVILVKELEHSKELEYGYLINGWLDDEERLNVKLFTLDGKIDKYTVADRVNVNGTTITDSGKVFDKLTQGTGSVKSDLIMYSLTSDGKIRTIKQAYDEWAAKKGVDYYNNPLELSAYSAKRIFKNGFFCYKTSEGTFDLSSTTETEAYKEFFVTNNTLFISVSASEEQKNDDRAYSLKRYSDFAKDGIYTVKGYNMNSNYEMDIVVVEDQLALISDNDAQLGVIGRISEAANDEGDIVKQITMGYQANISDYLTAEDVAVYEWNFTAAADQSNTISIDSLNKGDVVRLSFNSFGEISVIARLYNSAESTDEFMNSRNMYSEKAYGHVKEKLSNMFVVTVEANGIETDYIYRPGTATVYYIYNETRGKVRMGSYEDMLDDKTSGSGSRVFLRARDTELQEVIIFEKD